MIATHGTYDPDDDATKTPENGYGTCGNLLPDGAICLAPPDGADGACSPCRARNPEPCPACGVIVTPGGCDCYGIPTPVPRYPSSADIAEFRASLLAQSLRAGGAPIPDPWPDVPRVWAFRGATPDLQPTGIVPLFTDPAARPVSGAWADERRDGIGYRQTTGQTWAYETWSDNPAIARREASALRSRALARMDPADPWTSRGLRAFAPTR